MLKSCLYRHMIRRRTNRWTDALSDDVDSCNRSHYRHFGSALVDVTPSDEDEIAKRLYPPKPSLKLRCRRWSAHCLIQTRVSERLFIEWYRGDIRDYRKTSLVSDRVWTRRSSEDKNRHLKEHEIQKVVKTDDVYAIEKILKTRRRDGNFEYSSGGGVTL
jgi:hypothetical protein